LSGEIIFLQIAGRPADSGSGKLGLLPLIWPKKTRIVKNIRFLGPKRLTKIPFYSIKMVI